MKDKKTFYQRLLGCLGQVVALRRKRLGMSQEELASEANLDRAFISDIERNKRNPSFRTMATIAHALNMKYARLVHNSEQCAEGKDDKCA